MHALSELVRTYDGALAPELCTHLISEFHRLESFQQRNGAGVRAGLETSAWYELDIGPHLEARIRDLFIERINQYHQSYNADLAMGLPISPVRRTSQLILKRYRPGSGEQFQLHFDALGPVANRYLVFLWYLNDVEIGGETTFPDLNVQVTPRVGTLLMFPPYWMFQHRAMPPVSGDKYILSTYLLY